jgi:WD40 repeat protein
MMRNQIPLMAAALLSLLAADIVLGQGAATDRHGDPLPPGAVARLGTVRFRHPSSIVFAAFLPDGKRILSVSDGGMLSVCDYPSGKEIRHLELLDKSTALVTSATLSPDGKHVTVWCSDGFLRIWDWANARQTGKVANLARSTTTTVRSSSLLRALGRSAPTSSSPAYSPDGKTLLLFGSSQVLQLLELASGKEIAPGPGHTEPVTSIWCSPDGTRVVTKDTKTTLAWNAGTGAHLGTLPVTLPPTPGSPTVISPDGRLGVTVATFATPAAAQAAKARDAILFDTASGKPLGTVGLDVDVTPMHRRPLAFSRDGKLLAALLGNPQPKINLYEVPSGKLLRAFDLGGAGVVGNGGFGGPGGLGGPGGGGFSRRTVTTLPILFSPDGKTLACQAVAGANIVVLDIATGKQLATLPPPLNSQSIQGAFSPDGRCLALQQRDGTATVYELATGRPRGTFGDKLALAVVRRAAVLDDFPFGATLPETPGLGLAIAPDSRLLALAGPGGSIHLWDLLTGKQVHVLQGHTGIVNAVAFTAHGKKLVSASDDTTVLVWDMTKIARPTLPVKAVKPGELDPLWQSLLDPDAAKGFVVMRELAAAPGETVPWIKEHVKPSPPLDMKRVEALMRQLDDDRFKVRAKATADLLKLGELLLPVIDKALAGDLSSEVRRRLEELHGKLTVTILEGDRLRDMRAVEILELIGTPEARQVLRTLADGAPGALVTTSAQAVLRRQEHP